MVGTEQASRYSLVGAPTRVDTTFLPSYPFFFFFHCFAPHPLFHQYSIAYASPPRQLSPSTLLSNSSREKPPRVEALHLHARTLSGYSRAHGFVFGTHTTRVRKATRAIRRYTSNVRPTLLVCCVPVRAYQLHMWRADARPQAGSRSVSGLRTASEPLAYLPYIHIHGLCTGHRTHARIQRSALGAKL